MNNILASQSQATARLLANASNGNVGALLLSLIANTYNNQLAQANAFRLALEYNQAQRAKVEEFNRATDLANALMEMQAALANMLGRQSANSEYAKYLAQSGILGQQARDTRDAAISGNLSAFALSLGNIGKEGEAMRLIRAIAEGTGIPLNEVFKGLYGVKACGGKLKKRNKKGLTY